MGVRRSKLISWDVPHRYKPQDYSPKSTWKFPIRLAYAGTVNEEKGVGDLIRAVALLKNKLDVRCSIAGTGEVGALTQLAEQLGVSGLVNFTGQIGNDSVFKLYREADLAIVPSRREFPEGFPLTMFEAIASRTPIVCSDHPIFTPIMKDKNNAAVFRNGRPDSLMKTIAAVLSDGELYARYSEQAVHTWEKLGGTADWRTMIREWATMGSVSSQGHNPQLCRAEHLYG